ncbi:MAG: ATP-binding cassette domain-containing protein, partial [Candidatus Heimdallarchaeaceae archaeon]
MIECQDVIKVYSDPLTGYKVAALRGLDLRIRESELVSIIGPSGAGKTTLINILAGLDVPTSGIVRIEDIRLDQMGLEERREYRYYNIGLINQFVSQNLFPNLTVRKNILFTKNMYFLPHEQAKKKTEELLELLNLKHIANQSASKISGGEAMRLSMAVALAKDPRIILADEPTGQLDTENTRDIIEALREINTALGVTILVVTHDIRFRTVFDKSFIIRDGRLVGISSDISRKELEFLMDATKEQTSYIDPSNFVRIPDAVKTSIALRDTVVFEAHPSRKFGLLWNPEIISRAEVFELLAEPHEEIEEEIDEITFEDIEPLLAREFVPLATNRKIAIIKGLKKGYQTPVGYHEVIKHLDLEIQEGDFVFISGPSGVGKTTLLNMLSGLDKPDAGEIIILDKNFNNMTEYQISKFRLEHIAYVSQHNNLLDILPISDLMLLPYLFQTKKVDYKYMETIAKECQIKHKLQAYADELSAGEKQRASLATSLVRKTTIILAD